MQESPATLQVGVKGDEFLTDAVLIQKADGVIWGPMVQHLLEGSHCFKLTSLQGPKGSERKVSLSWQSAADVARLPHATGLVPGLYRVQGGKPGDSDNCTLDADSSAWVLLVPENKFAPIQKAWNDASAELDQLEASETNPRTLLVFRHEILTYLADSLSL